MYFLYLIIAFRSSQDCCDAMDESKGGTKDEDEIRKGNWFDGGLPGGCANSSCYDRPNGYIIGPIG